jgi:bifunctional DNA-binding transcriptional regulator/antitoxin component of YhaV-PrlF toxin-antitoxin module
MAKVTSKLQVTLPKALARQYGIRPGDDILWIASGDAIRVVRARKATNKDSLTDRLKLFEQSVERRRRRYKKARGPEPSDRGWTREELYDRGRPR